MENCFLPQTQCYTAKRAKHILGCIKRDIASQSREEVVLLWCGLILITVHTFGDYSIQRT